MPPSARWSPRLRRAGAHGLTQADVNDTISTAWGGAYVNDFIDRGRVKRVYVQADAPYRSRPEDLGLLYVRGQSGDMTPLTAFASSYWKSGTALRSEERREGQECVSTCRSLCAPFH